MTALALLGLGALVAGAQTLPEDAPPGAASCIEAYALKPESIAIDERRWKRLCLKGLEPDDMSARAEAAAPCLPEAKEAPAGPEREQAIDGCWGLTEEPQGPAKAHAAKGPSQPAPAVAAPPELSAKNKAVAKAVAAGDVAKIYGEDTPSAEALIAQTITPAASPVPGGGGSGGSAMVDSVPGLSPDNLEVPDPGLGKAPDDIPACGSVRKTPQGEENSKLYARLEAGAACLPWVGKPMLHYLKVLGMRGYNNSDSVGGQNAGLNRFYESLALDDPEFRAQVKAFYQAVRDRDGGVSLPDKPRMDDKTGSGALKDLEPGWAWKEALKASGNDPNRAMRLIGFCGHDDTAQSRLLSKRTPDEAVKAMEEGRSAIQARIAAIEARLAAAGQPLDYDEAKDPQLMGPYSMVGGENPSQLRYERRNLLRNLGKVSPAAYAVKAESVCPGGNSAFYSPGSLGAETLLPKGVQERVAAAQAPKDGPHSLPAKYYHTIGAAATACELVRKGAPAWFTKMVQKNAAWAYRALRLDERARISLMAREAYKQEFKAVSASGGADKALSFEKFVEQKYAQAAPGDSLPGEETPAALKRKRVELSYVDAFTLMEARGYGGYKVFGTRIPFSDTRLPGVKEVKALFWGAVPREWSRERAEAAEKRLKTFLVDSEWTVAQHRLGAEFAAKRCKPEEAAGKRS